MGWESFGVVRFDLGPLLQGQTRIAKTKVLITRLVLVVQVWDGLFIWGLRRFQHCTGHIMTGSWKGRGNQYIEFARVVYCKLPTNGKQLPAFPLEPLRGSNPGLRGGRRECL